MSQPHNNDSAGAQQNNGTPQNTWRNGPPRGGSNYGRGGQGGGRGWGNERPRGGFQGGERRTLNTGSGRGGHAGQNNGSFRGRGNARGGRHHYGLGDLRPKPTPDVVTILTDVPAQEQPGLLQVIRQNLVIPYQILKTHPGYNNVYGDKGFGWRRTDVASGVVPAHRYFLQPADPSNPKRPFVVVDGEFIRCHLNGNADPNESYMGRICMIDGLTNEILIDNYCMPSFPTEGKITSLNTLYSGIDRDMITAAKARGEAYMGLAELNAAVAKFADESTIFGFHAGFNDLAAMHLCAPENVVDSQILYSNVDGNLTPGLKTCAEMILGETIQPTKVHSAYEDAAATRELIIKKAREILNGGTAPTWTARPPPANRNGYVRGHRTYDVAEW